MSKESLSIKDKIAIVASISALTLSLFGFVKDNLLNQHVLRASVVNINQTDDRMLATVLLVNAGKHYETLYKAALIYSDDLSKGGGALSKESLGPVVLKPGESVVLTLDAKRPDIKSLREELVIQNPNSGIHFGVIFDALTPAGELREDSRIFRVTELFENGARPREGDHNKLIDLL